MTIRKATNKDMIEQTDLKTSTEISKKRYRNYEHRFRTLAYRVYSYLVITNSKIFSRM